MSVLNQNQKDIIKKYPIGDGMDIFHFLHRDAISKDPSLSTGEKSLPQGARTLLKGLFFALSELPAYRALSDLADLPRLQSLAHAQQLPSDINSGALSTLFDCVIHWPKEEEPIWTATYNLVAPKTVSRANSTSPLTANPAVVGLYDAWRCLYFTDSLNALQQQMRDCINDCLDYYAKIFVFVQSSGTSALIHSKFSSNIRRSRDYCIAESDPLVAPIISQVSG
ncbi:hypothetical protein MMC31_007435 [Peltigera leucophlebia]|nr:hypothetical protein [Peltigera leucophlebia]